MRLIVAILLGLLSGFLIYMGSAMMFMDLEAGSGPSPIFVIVTLFGGWCGTSYFLYRGAKSVSRVFSRGALVGAAEWLFIGLAGIVMSGRAASSSLSQSGAEAAGAALGGGLMATVAGGISILMAVVCLIVFAIAHFAGRELADTTSTPTKRCPDCAEMVQAEARKCKHCGAALTPSRAVA